MIPERFPITKEISDPPFRGVVVVDSAPDRFLRSGGTVERLISLSAMPVKESKSTRTAILDVECGRGESEKELVFFKEYRLKNLPHSLKSNFCRHRAEVVWELSWMLIALGVPVPRPSGCLLKKRGPFYLSGYSFSELIPASRHLAAMAERADALDWDLGALIESVADQVAKLHEGRVVHGDLKWTNILVHESGERLWLVDLDSARHHKRSPEPGAVAEDLARFVFGGVQAGMDGILGERFLDRYSERRGLARKTLDPYVQKLLGKLMRRHRL